MSWADFRKGIEILDDYIPDHKSMLDTGEYKIEIRIPVDWDKDESLEDVVPKDVIEELDKLGFHKEETLYEGFYYFH